MEIRINDTTMTWLKSGFRHLRLSEEQIKELVHFSLAEAEVNNACIYDEKQTAFVFCLCAASHMGDAVFLRVFKHAITSAWLAQYVYYRTPGVQNPKNEKDPFNDNLFRVFPNLRERIEELSDMRLKSWQPHQEASLVGPSADGVYDIIREAVVNSFGGYVSRIYDSKAFGYSEKTQIDIILEDVLEAYDTAREHGNLYHTGTYLICETSFVNANSEYLYLVIATDDDDYRAEICSYTSIQGLFHADAGDILNEIRKMRRRQEKSLLWHFAKFTPVDGLATEYSDLYLGEGIAQNVRLLNETWSFDSPNERFSEVRCLGNYLEGTFLRLLYEYKVWILDGNRQRTDDPDKRNYAVFNTGLVDISYRPIYMIFRWEYSKWVVDSFRTVGNGVLSGRDESECPPKADYVCGNILRTMYCTDERIVPNWRTPKKSLDHCLWENFDRLPNSVKEYGLEGFYSEYQSADNKMLLLNQIANSRKRRIEQAFENALDVAIARAAWNMRTGVPVYYYKDGNVNVLLPLAMRNALDYELGNEEGVDADSKCDTAALMVLTRSVPGDELSPLKYECKTLFSLSMAYRDARLINRPESDWLTPNI